MQSSRTPGWHWGPFKPGAVREGGLRRPWGPGAKGKAPLPLVSSSSMVVLVLSEDSCQREQGGIEACLASRRVHGQQGAAPAA